MSVDHEYSQCVPGWNRSGSAASRTLTSARVIFDGRPGDPLVERVEVEPRAAWPVADARHVHEHVAHRHRACRRHEADVAVGVALAHLHVGPLGQELRDRVAQRDTPRVEQRQQGDAGDRLGHRVEAPDRVVADRLAALEVHRAERRRVRVVAATEDDRVTTRDLAGIDVTRSQVLVDPSKSVRVEARGLRIEGGHGASASSSSMYGPYAAPAVPGTVAAMDTDALFSVSGKAALVTGGSRGIGLMIAEGLLSGGARVYISARKAAVCDEAAERLSQFGPCVSIPADLSTKEGSTGSPRRSHAGSPHCTSS